MGALKDSGRRCGRLLGVLVRLGAIANQRVPFQSKRECAAVLLSAAFPSLHAFYILWFPPALDHINPV